MSILGDIVARARGQYGRGHAATPKRGAGVPDNPLRQSPSRASLGVASPSQRSAPDAPQDAPPKTVEAPIVSEGRVAPDPTPAEPTSAPVDAVREELSPAEPDADAASVEHPIEGEVTRKSTWQVPLPKDTASPDGQHASGGIGQPNLGTMIRTLIEQQTGRQDASPGADEPVAAGQIDQPEASASPPLPHHTPANPAPRARPGLETLAALPTDAATGREVAPGPVADQTKTAEKPVPVTLSIGKLAIEVAAPPPQTPDPVTGTAPTTSSAPARPTWSASSQLRRAGVRRL